MSENRKFTLYHTLRRIAAPHLVVSRSTYRLIRLTINPFNDNNILINIDKYFDTKTGGRSTDTGSLKPGTDPVLYVTTFSSPRVAALYVIIQYANVIKYRVVNLLFDNFFVYTTLQSLFHIQRMSCHRFRYIFNGPLAACVRFVRDPYTKII